MMTTLGKDFHMDTDFPMVCIAIKGLPIARLCVCYNINVMYSTSPYLYNPDCFHKNQRHGCPPAITDCKQMTTFRKLLDLKITTGLRRNNWKFYESEPIGEFHSSRKKEVRWQGIFTILQNLPQTTSITLQLQNIVTSSILHLVRCMCIFLFHRKEGRGKKNLLCWLFWGVR